jgi:pimeloyl-ACP methyl ester carboxylesterase
MSPSIDDGSVLEALRCAQASWLAYFDAAALPAEAAAARFTLVDALTRGSNAAIVVDQSDLRIVAFRGTDECADWWTNLNILFRKAAWGRVHRGFCLAAERFWPDVQRHVREARSDGRRVWVTGHSLGGAIAVLAAGKLLADEADAVEGLCTFGQPPVGGRTFRVNCNRVLGERYLRIVNHTDSIVEQGLFCEHAGRLWYFDADGRLHHDMSFRRSLRDMWAANRRLGGLYMFGAHNMKKEYLPLLELQLTSR